MKLKIVQGVLNKDNFKLYFNLKKNFNNLTLK